jgi:zinc transport system permease protein
MNPLEWLPLSWFDFDFMRHALLAILLAAPLFGLLGSLIINSEMVFFSDAMGHAALTGIAIGALLGLGNPLPAMILFAILLAGVITLLHRHSTARMDTLIGLIMAFTVALGVVLLSRGGGFARYARYLIGDVLTITPMELIQLAVLLAITLVLWFFFFNRLFFIQLNRSLAISRGIRIWRMETLFTMVVAVVVTVSVQWVGLLVINSLLILPAAAARNLARHTASYVLLTILISMAASVAGLVSSFYWDTATGATIVLYAMGFYVLSVLLRRR